MREILVFGDKTFKIRVPEDAKLTFGPFSPPPRGNARASFGDYGPAEKAGTLRVYGKTQKDVLAVFSGVRGFRDLSIGYAEQVAVEEGATLWKSDDEGYKREEKVKREKKWVEGEVLALPEGRRNRRKRS